MKRRLKKEIVGIFEGLTNNWRLLENAKRDLGEILRKYEILSKKDYKKMKALWDGVKRDERARRHQEQIAEEIFGAMEVKGKVKRRTIQKRDTLRG